MRDFREDLLEFLLEHSSTFVDIQPLYEKYCGVSLVFEEGDDTISICRGNLNIVLRELADMKWINLYPTNGYSRAHKRINPLGNNTLRQFSLDIPVQARLTTLGEIEYKKSKKEDKPNVEMKIGGDFKGIMAAGDMSNPSYLEAHLPADTPQAKTKSIKNTIISIGKWLIKHIWQFLFSLAVAYIIFRLGWN